MSHPQTRSTTANWQKFRSICIVSLCALAIGCSGAVRLETYQLTPDPERIVEKSTRLDRWETYQCGASEISIRHQWYSQRYFMGPVVPVIPFRQSSSGAFEVKTNGIQGCPIIRQNGEAFAAEINSGNESLCRYDRQHLELTSELLVVGKTSTGECSTEPFFYMRDVDWDYCFVCSA